MLLEHERRKGKIFFVSRVARTLIKSNLEYYHSKNSSKNKYLHEQSFLIDADDI